MLRAVAFSVCAIVAAFGVFMIVGTCLSPTIPAKSDAPLRASDEGASHRCVAPCLVILPAGSAEDDFLLDYVGQRATRAGYPVLSVTVRER